MAHETIHWELKLPIVLLALRNTIKPDIGHTSAEVVYGASLRLPSEFFHSSSSTAQSTPELFNALNDFMAQLQHTNGKNHATRRFIFVPEDLSRVSHVFLRVDAVKTPLQPRYEGP